MPRQRFDETPFVGSIALLRRFTEDQEQWLGVWDDEQAVWALVQARRESPETFRTCLVAALEDALGLSGKRDFLISGLSRAHHQAPIEWPAAERAQWIVVEFFPVDLYGTSAGLQIDDLPNVRWLTLSEIARGTTGDGQHFCPRQRLLIQRADILPPGIRDEFISN